MHLKLWLLKATTDHLHWRHKKISRWSEWTCLDWSNDFTERYSTLKVAALALHYNNPLCYRATGKRKRKGRAERVGAVQPGEEKAAVRPYCSLSVPEPGPQERQGKYFQQGLLR